MSVDLRTRRDDDVTPVTAMDFFSQQLPEALERSRDLVEPGAAHLRLRPLSVDVEGECWSLSRPQEAVRVERGGASDGAALRLDCEALTELVHDRVTPMTFFTAGRLDMPSGGLPDFLNWWLVLRSALDERPIHTPGAVTFRESDGSPLDLGRSFRMDDPIEAMSHFLHEAGFLHLQGVFDPGLMARISEDMDRAAPSYAEGDARSWWATTADGTRRLVRMQGFDERSEGAAALLRDERFLGLGAIPGDGHSHQGMSGNRIEALFKPIGVTAGISDVPWHKDCSLGRHSYECCNLTVGISVTGADATSGQLRVVAGSHRALIWPAMIQPADNDLPELDLPTGTGDVTVHLSCTLHMAQPPVLRERRVMYTSFRLPALASAARSEALARLQAVREGAYTTVSQEPADPVRPS